MKLLNWIEDWKAQYNKRELEYMEVQKVLIQIQLKDKETGEMHIQNSEYKSKDAENLILKGVV
jgi:hypothetical protein